MPDEEHTQGEVPGDAPPTRQPSTTLPTRASSTRGAVELPGDIPSSSSTPIAYPEPQNDAPQYPVDSKAEYRGPSQAPERL